MAKKNRQKAKKAAAKKKTKAGVKKSKPTPKKKLKTKKTITRMPVEEGTLIGRVTHYFPRVKAGAILIEKDRLALGDTIRIKGHTSNFKQKIMSMQIDRVPIEKASKGHEIGIFVKSRVRMHDRVYKIQNV